MKDSQQKMGNPEAPIKYIKADNERFSTQTLALLRLL